MPRAALLLLCAALAGLGAWTARAPAPRWFKGNTHAHTLWSDGDGAPELVTDWYREHGYDFLVLSDHNVFLEGDKWFPIGSDEGARLTDAHVAELRARFGADAVAVRERDGTREMRLVPLAELRRRFERPGAFLLVPGEEITDGTPSVPVHVNGLNLAEVIAPQGGATALEMAERDLAAVIEQGKRLGRPVLGHLNHPNFRWAFTADDLAQLASERFFEVYNGHPGTNTNGTGEHPGAEALWDLANARRRYELDLPLLYALATDDTHDYHDPAGSTGGSHAGRGWIQVRAAELTPAALIEAMRAGAFYASTGVTLDDVRFDGRTLVIDIAADAGVRYTTRFLGAERRDGAVQAGVLFAESSDDPASYTLTGREGYVRATVVSSRPQADPAAPGDLERAWTQPVGAP